MKFDTETWVTAAGNFIVFRQGAEIDEVALKIHNQGRRDDEAIWSARTDVIDTPAFGGRVSQTVLRRRIYNDDKVTEITLVINPAHIYSVRSSYTSVYAQ